MTIRRKTPLKRNRGPSKRSRSLSNKNKRLNEVYEKIDIDRDRICAGCGATKNLSHSHIISREDHELMDDPENITYHCLPMHDNAGCSYNWEQVGERVKLLDYKVNMEYIRKVRPELYRKMIIDDYYYYQKSTSCVCFPENYSYICTSLRNIEIN